MDRHVVFVLTLCMHIALYLISALLLLRSVRGCVLYVICNILQNWEITGLCQKALEQYHEDPNNADMIFFGVSISRMWLPCLPVL